MSNNGGRWQDSPEFSWLFGQENFHDEFERAALRRMVRQALDDKITEASFAAPPDYGRTFADELQHPLETLTYRFDGLSVEGGNTLLVARSKVGKTTLTANAVRALATGEPFLGQFYTAAPDGGIAFWNYELTRPQFHAMALDLGMAAPEVAERFSPLHLRGYRLQLWTPKGEEWAVRWLAEREVEVWFIDPLQRAKAGVGSLNDNDDMDRFFEAVDVIKERAGVQDVFLSVHASDKKDSDAEGADDPLGASRIHGWYDARWTLSADAAGRRWLTADGRDVGLPEQVLTWDADTRRLTMPPVSGSRIGAGGKRETQERERFVELVRACVHSPGCTSKLLRGALGGKTERKTDIIDRAAALGYIEDAETERANLNRWHATDKGMELLSELEGA